MASSAAAVASAPTGSPPRRRGRPILGSTSTPLANDGRSADRYLDSAPPLPAAVIIVIGPVSQNRISLSALTLTIPGEATRHTGRAEPQVRTSVSRIPFPSRFLVR